MSRTARRIRAQRSASIAIGFSVMTSHPSSMARTMYSSCVRSIEATITVSGRVSATIASKRSAGYSPTVPPVASRNRCAWWRIRVSLTSHRATSSTARAGSASAATNIPLRAPVPTIA